MTAILINQLKLFPQEFRIYRGKQVINLQPKCSELLLYLAERPGQVISKETLLENIWSGRVVGEDVLTNCIRKLRKQLNDDAKSPQLIETINKKGYRMIAKVRPPKLKGWWKKLVLKIFAGLFSMAVIGFFLTHSHVSIYSFADTDTAKERQRKLHDMAGIINEDPNGTHSISYSFDN